MMFDAGMLKYRPMPPRTTKSSAPKFQVEAGPRREVVEIGMAT